MSKNLSQIRLNFAYFSVISFFPVLYPYSINIGFPLIQPNSVEYHPKISEELSSDSNISFKT